MATPATVIPQLDQKATQSRREAVESVLGTTLAEGVSPSPEVLALFESYVSGQLSLEQVMPAIRTLDEI